MVDAKVSQENRNVPYLFEQALKSSCVPRALGTSVGVVPDNETIGERFLDLMKISLKTLKVRSELLNNGMEEDEIDTMQGKYHLLGQEINKINQFIGKMRDKDTPLGNALKVHRFVLVTITDREVNKLITNGEKFLAVMVTENNGLHLACLGLENQNCVSLSDVTTDGKHPEVEITNELTRLMGWRVIPNSKK